MSIPTYRVWTDEMFPMDSPEPHTTAVVTYADHVAEVERSFERGYQSAPSGVIDLNAAALMRARIDTLIEAIKLLERERDRRRQDSGTPGPAWTTAISILRTSLRELGWVE